VTAAEDPQSEITLLDTERLRLEPLRVEHATEMASLLDDQRLHEFTGGRPSTLPELRARYARQVVGWSPDGRRRWLNWIARGRADGLAVGFVQATVNVDPPASAELAWTIAVAFQRRGYAREATGAVADWLRDHGVRMLSAHIRPGHEASEGVARALGLTATDQLVDGELLWSS
jgi:RimJ/RimL family protein N-acetyltransferase